MMTSSVLNLEESSRKIKQKSADIEPFASLLKYAKSLGFLTVIRIFMLDSKSIDSLEKINVENEIDIIEMMPGIVVTVLEKEVAAIKKTIIAGGLIHGVENIQQILKSGASAVSTSDETVWNMQTVS